MMDTKKIGEFLKALRKAKGLTQEDVASELFVSPKTISRWESGLGIPDINIISSVAEFYGVTVDEILKGERNKKEAPKEETVTLNNKKKEKLIINNLIDKYNKYFLTSLIILGVCLLLGIVIGFIASSLVFYFLAFLGIIVSTIVIVIANKEIKRVEDDEDIINSALEKSFKIIKQRNLLFTDILIGSIILILICMLILGHIYYVYGLMTILCIVASYLVLRFAINRNNNETNKKLFYVALIIGITSIFISYIYEITKFDEFNGYSASSYERINFWPVIYFSIGYKTTYRVTSFCLLIVGLLLMVLFSIKKKLIPYIIGYILAMCAGVLPYFDYYNYSDFTVGLSPSVMGFLFTSVEIALIIYLICIYFKNKKKLKMKE